MTSSMRRGSGWCVAAAVLAACGPNDPPTQVDAGADAAIEASAAAATPGTLGGIDLSAGGRVANPEVPTVTVGGVTCVRRSDGPPYNCSPCMVGAACDTGVPCRLGRISRCIVDRGVCDDIGPAPNGSTCGAMGSGMVCTSGTCGCAAGQQNCGGVCRAAGSCVNGVGGCAVAGSLVCSGTNVVCNAVASPPQTETCNGIDDDCDGIVDDITSTACAPAQCQTGASYCMGNVLACARTGNSPAGTACPGVAGGVCDGVGTCVCPAGQSNCSGTCRPTGTGCSVGVGACRRSGVIVCSGAGTACSVSAGAPTPETCNGVDDDCDGTVDNIPATACAPSVCQTGVTVCSGAATVCVATANRPFGTSCTPPGAGVCNGSGTCVCPAGTNDCGGICTAGVGNGCTAGTGVCQRWGTIVCTGAGTAACNTGAGGPTEAPERSCTNGLDDDCDGLVDLADPDCPRGPPNDRCPAATAISLGAPGTVVTVSGNTSTAVHDTTGSCGNSGSAADVFYRFDVTQRSLVYADAFGTGYDVVLFFNAGCTATQVGGYACNDDSCGTLQSQIVQVLNPGTYYLVVSGFGGGSGPFTVNLQNLPASDRVFGLPQGVSTVAGNTSGLSDRHTPGCAFSSAPDETFYYTTCPAYGGGSMSANMCGRAGWDTMLAFRQGNSGAVACNDDSCGLQSNISGGVTGGAAIRALYADGYSSSSGGYSVWTSIP